MNRIDKLILKAQRATRPGLGPAVALIEHVGDSWTAEVHLSQGHALIIKRATWATLEHAVEHIRAVAQEYPNSCDMSIIVDDLG